MRFTLHFARCSSLPLWIPKDVAVVGYDNMVGMANLFLQPLTTV